MKRLLVVLFATCLATLFGTGIATADDVGNSAASQARLMVPGWNLGNTLDACSADHYFTNNGQYGSETWWQGTLTTRAVVDAVAAAGFRSVRLPVAWLAGHVVGGTETEPEIDSTWMARVHEIVDWCVADSLYVIINDHWDGGWLETLGYSTRADTFGVVNDSIVQVRIATLKHLWTLIATEFADCDDHVLFAGQNEPFQDYPLFHTLHRELTPILVRYNAAFVEAVRATGGRNKTRTLVVQVPSANIASAAAYMPASLLPEPPGHLMVEVHYYDPGQFCGTYDSNVYFWGAGNRSTSNNAVWGDEAYMRSQFRKMRDAYVSKGYPVVLGEYAARQRTVPFDQDKHDASIRLFYKLVQQYAIRNGLVPFAWDINDVAGLKTVEGAHVIIDRSTCTVVGQNAMTGILEGVADAVWMADDVSQQ